MRTTGPPRRIRFFPDYGHGPLWESYTDKYAMDPADYGLSPSLSSDLQAWFEFWESHFAPFTGWDSPENRESSRNAAQVLIRRLREEVADIAEVVDETDWIFDG